MKIKYSSLFNDQTGILRRKRIVYKYTLVDSILKTHFKMLMRLSSVDGYHSKSKTGYIAEPDKEAFLALVEKIEKSNSKRAKTSHQKSIERKKTASTKIDCNHDDLGSFGYRHGERVVCPHCGQRAEVW